MHSSDEHQKPLLGNQSTKKQALPDDFPYLRAWIGAFGGIVLYMLCGISIVPFVSQYVVYRLSEGVSNMTNSTANESNVCHRPVHGPAEQQIQKEASTLTLYYSLATAGTAIAINLFLGPMSDFIGRRVLFVLPLVGIVLKAVVLCFIVYFHLDMNFIYLAYTLDGICGSYYAVLVAAFTYSADITIPGRSRTIAIACMEGCLAIAAACGGLASGYLIKSTGYFYPCLMFVIIAVLDLVLVFVLLPETLIEKKKINKSPIYHIKNVFGFYCTKGTTRMKCIYIVLMLMFFFSVIVVLGRTTLETIYQLGAPFCWDPVKIGFYGALRLALQFICSILAIKGLQYCISDELIAIISSISAIGSFVFEALATTGTMMYIVPVVGIIGSGSVPIARSLMSKLTSPDQQGALFASIAIVETVCNTASNSLYNLVFNATVSYYKGAVWFMMAGMCVINIVIILIYMCISKGHTESRLDKEVHVSVNEGYGSAVNSDRAVIF